MMNVAAGDVGRIPDPNQCRGVLRRFQRLGEHEADGLALVVNQIVLQHVEALPDRWVGAALVLAVRKPRSIVVGQYGNDAWGALRYLGINRGDTALRNGA